MTSKRGGRVGRYENRPATGRKCFHDLTPSGAPSRPRLGYGETDSSSKEDGECLEDFSHTRFDTLAIRSALDFRGFGRFIWIVDSSEIR